MLKIFVLVCLFSSSIYAQNRSISAERQSSEDYKSLYLEHKPASSSLLPEDFTASSAYDEATSFDALDMSVLPDWYDQQVATAAFQYIRDERFLKRTDAFPRRLSWLYPQDGCFMRAENMARQLEENYYPDMMKVFIFGNLKVQTRFSPYGAVSWWYHVAPIISLNGQPLVFDPAINPYAPTPLEEWILKQTNDLGNVGLSFCSSKAYGPYDNCKSSRAIRDSELSSDADHYLSREWSNVQGLGLVPEDELGDTPYWYFTTLGSLSSL
ncbi:MAG: hypothetical protein H6621_12610 [Halobacteriovoraceae bacterium]|nr:hypothetical protein [Halobacteriovoraceae bacterium]MCB9095902.1 hypothetical protein [Halobacteriovoraceae bacterium]